MCQRVKWLTRKESDSFTIVPRLSYRGGAMSDENVLSFLTDRHVRPNACDGEDDVTIATAVSSWSGTLGMSDYFCEGKWKEQV